MGKRRHFIIPVLGSVVLCLILWRVFHWPANVPPEEAQALVRVWLANDYREAGQDPALRPPAAASVPPSAAEAETQPIRFVRFDTVRPFFKPQGVAHAALVRVEIRIQGGLLPDGEALRYFSLTQKDGASWQVSREISESAFRWRLGG